MGFGDDVDVSDDSEDEMDKVLRRKAAMKESLEKTITEEAPLDPKIMRQFEKLHIPVPELDDLAGVSLDVAKAIKAAQDAKVKVLTQRSVKNRKQKRFENKDYERTLSRRDTAGVRQFSDRIPLKKPEKVVISKVKPVRKSPYTKEQMAEFRATKRQQHKDAVERRANKKIEKKNSRNTIVAESDRSPPFSFSLPPDTEEEEEMEEEQEPTSIPVTPETILTWEEIFRDLDSIHAEAEPDTGPQAFKVDDNMVENVVNKIAFFAERMLDEYRNSDINLDMSLEDISKKIRKLLCFLYKVSFQDTTLAQIATTLGIYLEFSPTGFVDDALKIGALATAIYGSKKIFQYLLSMIASYFSKPVIEAESFSDYVFKARGIINWMVASETGNNIKNVMLALTAYQLFPASVSEKITGVFGKVSKMPIIDLILLVFKNIADLFRVRHHMASGLPFSSALFSDYPLQTAIEELERLMLYKDRTYGGLPVEGYMSDVDFVLKVRTQISIIEASARMQGASVTRKLGLTSILTRASQAASDVARDRNNRVRMNPYGVAIVGMPGIGKSNMLTVTMRSNAEAIGKPFSQDCVYERRPEDKYWEGASDTHFIIHNSELGNKIAKYLESHGDPALSELTSLMDSQPFYPNMAFDKGKLALHPDFVYVDTNSPDLGAAHVVNNPAATLRRFLFMQVTVKEEYRKEGSGALDPIKCLVADPLDLHNIDLYRFVPIDNLTGVKKVLQANISFRQALEWMRKDVVEHFRRESTNQNRLKDAMEIEMKRLREIVPDNFIPPIPEYIRMNAPILEDKKEESDSDLDSNMDMDNYDDQEEVMEFLQDTAIEAESFRESVLSVPNRFMGLFNHGCEVIADGCGDLRNGGQALMMVMMFSLLITSAKRFKTENFLMRHQIDACILIRFLIMLSLFFIVRFIPWCLLWATYWWSTEYLLKALIATAKSTLLEWLNAKKIIWDARYRSIRGKAFVTLSLSIASGLATGIVISRAIYKLRTKEFFHGFYHGHEEGYMEGRESAILDHFAPQSAAEKDAALLAESISVQDVDDPLPLATIEKNIEAGTSFHRVANAQQNVYTMMSNVASEVPAHTQEPKSLQAAMSKNVRYVEIVDPKGNARQFLLGVTAEWALITTHALYFNDKDICTLKISHANHTSIESGNWIESLVRRKDTFQISSDVTLLRISGPGFKNRLAHFPEDEYKGKVTTGRISDSDVRIFSINEDRVITFEGKNYTHPFSYLYDFPKHKKGMCGLPLIASIGQGSQIIGLHGGGINGSSESYALPVCRKKINEGILFILGQKDSYGNDNLLGHRLAECERLPIVGEPNRKSPFCWNNFPAIDYIGKMEGNIILESESRVQPTPMNKGKFKGKIDEIFFDVLGHVRTKEFGKPILRPGIHKGEYINPYTYNLKKMNQQRKALDRDLTNDIVRAIVDHYVAGCHAKGITELKPVTHDVAINGGAPIDPYIRRINVKTGSGHGYKGKKEKHLPLSGKTEYHREMTPELEEDVTMILNNLAQGIPVPVISEANLKDEALERHKCDSGASRLFYAISVSMLEVQRQMLSPLYSLMTYAGEIFCAAIGINVFAQAQRIGMLGEKGGFILEIDYKKYDITQPDDVSWAVNSIIYEFLKRMGYNELALKILHTLLYSGTSLYIKMLQDLFLVNILASGKFGTAEENCIRSLFLAMYAYCRTTGNRAEQYFQDNDSRFYGDDTVINNQGSTDFNIIAFAKVAEEELGMEITMADKTADMRAFVKPEDMTFLKRRYVRQPWLGGRWCAPLELDSIIRSMTWYIPSLAIPKEEQIIDTLGSNLYELFLHLDRSSFDEIRTALIELYEEVLGLPNIDFMLPTYSKILDSYDASYESEFDESKETADLSLTGFTQHEVDAEAERGLDGPLKNMQSQDIFELKTHRAKLLDELKSLEDDVLRIGNPSQGLSHHDARSSLAYNTSQAYREHCDKYFKALGRFEAHKQSINVLDRAIARKSSIEAEADRVVSHTGPEDASMEIHHGTFTDMGGDDVIEENVSLTTPPLGMKNVGDDLDTQKFFARPVQVAQFNWTPGGAEIDVAVNPWNAYFLNPTVRSKLRNYGLIRADLVVTVAMSGNMFYRGKMLVGYLPFPWEVLPWVKLLGAITASSTLRPFKHKYMSQWYGTKTMDPKDNTPVEFHIPYVSPMPIARLYNRSASVLSDAVELDDLSLGNMYFSSLNSIQNASGSTAPVNVYVYAHLENVQINAPTGTVMTITAESSRDERKSGPVEKTASKLVDVSKALSNVPVIGPWASASTIAFGGVKQIAALLGWSMPNIIEAPNRVKNMPYQNSAQTVGYDIGQRITLDPKQELTIDPRVAGVDEDEMIIRNISSIESYVTTGTWLYASSPLSATIMKFMVTPQCTSGFITHAANDIYQPTACEFAVQPFKAWRGTVRCRLEFVVAGTDKGKAAIIWEPNISQYALINATIDTNKQYVKVVDLEQTQCVEFDVEWGLPRPWAITKPYDVCGETTSFINPTLWCDAANGYITVVPLTKLQTNDGSNVKVNLYMSVPDLSVNMVTEYNLPRFRKLILAEADRERPICCEDAKVEVINPTGISSEGLNQAYFGEQPISFRALLKRFWHSAIYATDPGGDVSDTWYANMNIWPYTRPNYYDSNGAHDWEVNLFAYLRWAYLGVRGGLRKRLRIIGLKQDNQCGLHVSNANPTVADLIPDSGYTGVGVANASRIMGTVSHLLETNGGIEFEVPFYSLNTFGFASVGSYPFTSDVGGSYLSTQSVRQYYVAAELSSPITGGILINEETATAEDFTFLRFIAAPPFSKPN